jgi:hypothetical protein
MKCKFLNEPKKVKSRMKKPPKGIPAPPPTPPKAGLAINWRAAGLAVLALALASVYLFIQFRGFSISTAMDQAQISREIAKGNGYTTQYIRPLAIWQLEHAGKSIPSHHFPELLQSPLNPLINALPLKLVESEWKLTPLDIVYIGDRVIAATAILFFLFSVVIWYFAGAILFDKKTALIGCAGLLLSDMMWQFSLSGLPQMLMLFLFACTTWLTLRAMENRDLGRSSLGYIFASALVFGLLTLAHWAALWIFLGWVIFATLQFPRKGLATLIALVGFLLLVGPWLLRNHDICGNPIGLAGYELITQPGTAETEYMRSLTSPPIFSAVATLKRFSEALTHQAGHIFSFLGINVIALMFFTALLHRFKLSNAASFRPGVLLMWGGAILGMGLSGVSESVSPNQLHVLFVPLFLFYGFAFLMVLWSRLEVHSPKIKSAFIAFLLLLCALPLLGTLMSAPERAIQWPPYVPPFIAVLGVWFEENEAICTDMPWAVSWYAQRQSLLLPKTIKQFNRISDYRLLGKSLNGLYLTPLTGNRALFSEVYKGAYSDWISLIMRPPEVANFSLPIFTPLPIDGECILFSDRNRWSRRN